MSLAYDSERRYVNLDGEPVHEDTLPEDMSDADYGEWFGRSFVPGGVGCRVGPPVQRVVPKEQLDAALARIERLEAEIAALKARYEPNLPESAVSKGELQTASWDKVQAIKAYRARVGCSLREAAHAIDAALSAQRGGE